MSFVESIRSIFTPFFNASLETQEKLEKGYLFEYGNGGAITGDSLVMTRDGSKRADKITSESYIITKNSYSQTIQRIKFLYEGTVYKYGDLYLTPYQPIIIEGKTHYPIDLNLDKKFYIGYVYNFVIYNKSVIEIKDNVFIIAINSAYQNFSPTFDDNLNVFNHPYFYSDKIRVDLLLCSNSFDVCLKDELFIRDIESNLIIGIDVNAARQVNNVVVKTGINLMNELYEFFNLITEPDYEQIAEQVDNNVKYNNIVSTMINSIENGKKSTNPEVVEMILSINNQNADTNC